LPCRPARAAGACDKTNKTQRGPDQSKHSCYSSHVGGRIRVLTWSVPATTSAIPCPKRVLVKPVKGALARARTLATRMATAGGFTYQLFLVQSNAKVHTPAPPPPLSKHQMKTHHLPIAAVPSLSWQNISLELSSRGRISISGKRCLTLYFSVGYYSSSKLTPQRTRLPLPRAQADQYCRPSSCAHTSVQVETNHNSIQLVISYSPIVSVSWQALRV
jgi:hypothetical protein